jgi:hypothetical protein
MEYTYAVLFDVKAADAYNICHVLTDNKIFDEVYDKSTHVR